MFALFMAAACGKPGDDTSSILPVLPGGNEIVETKPDTLEIKLGYDMSVSEEQLVPTRSEFGSDDLIGVQIFHLRQEDFYGGSGKVIYASGVFDSPDNLVFKFVKGNRYRIQMTYYPNAKNIVYNYPDGTYGAPFSDIFGLQSYKLNEPVYFSGVQGGPDGGPTLQYIFDPFYQPTEDRKNQSFKRGMTPRYCGEIQEVTIEEGVPVTIPLEYCMMGITLNVDNFTEGELLMDIRAVWDVRHEWRLRPGDDMSIQLQIQLPNIADMSYPYADDITLFYTNAKKEKYLLATKNLPYKPGVNYVFNFSLTEREDGSIGIQIPDDTLTDEVSSFD